MLANDLGRSAEFLVDRCAVGSDVIQAPEVEAANLVGLELFGERDGTSEDVVLLLVGGLGGPVEVSLGAVLGLGGPGPVDFEEWARDVRDLEAVLRENLLSFGYLGVGDGLEILTPHLAQLYIVQAEVVCDHGAGMIKVLRDLVRDDCNFEGGLRRGRETKQRSGCGGCDGHSGSC
ncbi:hypothetical protein [Tunturiibacter gelidiferens]|uniref:hypothetical protein n=1 Tax=Tunturiibacter gelidiferens TaxID=3069689 RepID=UPI003D9BC00B